MKQEVKAYDKEIYHTGPYTLEEFNDICKNYFEEAKAVWEDKTTQITRFTLELVTEWGSYGDRDRDVLTMHIFRTETDEEEKTRLEKAVKEKERIKKQKATLLANKKKKEELESNPEYKKFLKLKEKYENR